MKRTPQFILAVIILLTFANPAIAQSAITFGAPVNEIDFPDGMTFEISVSSSAGDIVSAELVYWVPGEVSFTNNRSYLPIEFTPAANVKLFYEMDTEGFTVFPSTPYNYFWEVTDSAGNTAASEEFYVRYDDNRYDWDIFQNDDVAVWTHGRPSSFGNSVFSIAKKAIIAQYPLFQIDTEFQMRIIVYNNTEEFAEWHSTSVAAIGGEASPNIGVTTQIVSSFSASSGWLNDVIPHEISHLYFAQAASNPKVAIPTWLNEGVASYNEFSNNSSQLREVERLAKSGELVSLSKLETGFGRMVDVNRFRIGYSEALSAVTYMVETFGEKGLADLLAAYKSGLPTDEAFTSAFGVDSAQFELDWTVWLGIPEGEYQIPTAWPMPTFISSPTPWILAANITQKATEEPQTSGLEPTPTQLAGQNPDSDEVVFEGGSLGTALMGIIALTCVSGLLLVAMLWFFNNRKKS